MQTDMMVGRIDGIEGFSDYEWKYTEHLHLHVGADATTCNRVWDQTLTGLLFNIFMI